MKKGEQTEELVEVLNGIQIALIFIAVFVGGLFIAKITEISLKLDGILKGD